MFDDPKPEDALQTTVGQFDKALASAHKRGVEAAIQVVEPFLELIFTAYRKGLPSGYCAKTAALALDKLQELKEKL